jgi:hypothetical protein
MLKKYFSYLNEEASAIDHLIKPDPKGHKDAMNDVVNFKTEFSTKMATEMQKVKEFEAKIKRELSEEFIDVLKKALMGRTILVQNEQGYNKILKVNNVVMGNTGADHYPVIIQNEKLKSRYVYEDTNKAKIQFVDTYLRFFEDHYLGEYIKFTGKSVKTGSEAQYTRHIIRIGIQHGTRDQIVVEDQDGVRYQLNLSGAIKIYDQKLKELDPYGEENWEN